MCGASSKPGQQSAAKAARSERAREKGFIASSPGRFLFVHLFNLYCLWRSGQESSTLEKNLRDAD